ncbi:MAG: hypothetical protein NC236_00395 [Mycoplasma sp.]|nr:hypothetical protein [Mycoplasma sp.]
MFFSISIGILICVFIIATSYLSGTIINNKFSIVRINVYSSFLIGIAFYLFITFIFYLPLVLLQVSFKIIVIFELLKNVCILVFIYLNKDNFNIKNMKNLIVFIILVILLSTIINIFLMRMSDGYDSITYLERNTAAIENGYINKLDTDAPIGSHLLGRWSSIYETETWVHWFAVIQYMGINPEFFSHWIGRIIITFIALSSIMYFTSKYTDNIFINFSISILFILLIDLIGTQFTNSIAGLYGRTYLLLFIFAISFENNDDVKVSLLTIMISFAAWSMSSSTIFLYGFFIVSIFALRIFWFKSNSVKYLFIESIPLLCMFALYKIDNTLLVVLSLFVLLFIFAIVQIDKKNIRIFETVHTYIYKYRVSLILAAFVSFIVFDIFLIATSKIDFWFAFNPRGDGLQEGSIIDNSIPYSIFISLLYLSVILICIFEFFKTKKQSIKYIAAFILFTSVFFFSPISAPLWNHEIKGLAGVYHRTRTNFFIPFIFILIDYIFRIKTKKIVPILGTSLSSIVFIINGVQSGMTQVVQRSQYTGSFKTGDLVADWLNKNLPNKTIYGDIFNWAYKYNGNYSRDDFSDQNMNNNQIFIYYENHIPSNFKENLFTHKQKVGNFDIFWND